MMTVKTKVHFHREQDGRKKLSNSPQPSTLVESGTIPRISRLMALAIKFDGLIRSGKVADITELAELAHVTQPRMTQIMNLTNLAPDIQEELLHLPRVQSGRAPIHLKMLLPIVGETLWKKQREHWSNLKSQRAVSPLPEQLHSPD